MTNRVILVFECSALRFYGSPEAQACCGRMKQGNTMHAESRERTWK